MAIQLELGLDTILSYRRLSYTPWHALAEFIDNSTQNYFNNSALLDAAYAIEKDRLEVSVVYERDDDIIRISDNALGMAQTELDAALKVGTSRPYAGGRSQFGMGMKTAACWLGNHWTVRTKKLWETTEYTVTVNVDDVANGLNDLPMSERTGLDPTKHHTIIEITQLNRRFHGRTLGKIKEFLASMYRQDLRGNLLVLRWRGGALTWDESDDRFVKAADGSPYKKDFDFPVNGKQVTGWVGVLAHGYAGRARAGFSILHSGRVIKGWPDSWRPEEIFGQLQGSNDLVNQRITGEVNLDGFEVSHTKDDIQWMEDEQDQVEKALKMACAPYIAVAKSNRKDVRDERGPSELEIKTAIDELQDELSSTELADLIEITMVPPPEVVTESIKPVIASVERREASLRGKVGSLKIDVYLLGDGSANDPYVAVDSMADDRVVVAVNMLHPYITQIAGSVGMRNYLRECTYDAIAEWQARHKTSTIDPNTIKMLKDALLRLPSELEMHAGS